jgi:hypothetical protein
MLPLMADETGRWVRIPVELRDRLAELDSLESSPPLSALLDLYDCARPEDWIAQLVEVNRRLSEELQRLQTPSAPADPRRRTA